MPVALTEKVAVAPAQVATSFGAFEIVGGWFTVKIALFVIAEQPEALTLTE